MHFLCYFKSLSYFPKKSSKTVGFDVNYFSNTDAEGTLEKGRIRVWENRSTSRLPSSLKSPRHQRSEVAPGRDLRGGLSRRLLNIVGNICRSVDDVDNCERGSLKVHFQNSFRDFQQPRMSLQTCCDSVTQHQRPEVGRQKNR